MIADVAIALGRPSRRWLLAASFVAHAAVIAGIAFQQSRPPPIAPVLLLRPAVVDVLLPLPPSAAHGPYCRRWGGGGCAVDCERWFDLARDIVQPLCAEHAPPALLRALSEAGVHLPACDGRR